MARTPLRAVAPDAGTDPHRRPPRGAAVREHDPPAHESRLGRSEDNPPPRGATYRDVGVDKIGGADRKGDRAIRGETVDQEPPGLVRHRRVGAVPGIPSADQRPRNRCAGSIQHDAGNAGPPRQLNPVGLIHG